METFWAAQDGDPNPELTVRFDTTVTFNRIVLQEYIPLGQRVAQFRVEAQDANGRWIPIASGTTIGNKRILLTGDVTTRAIRIMIDRSLAPPVLNGLSLFEDNIYTGLDG